MIAGGGGDDLKFQTKEQDKSNSMLQEKDGDEREGEGKKKKKKMGDANVERNNRNEVKLAEQNEKREVWDFGEWLGVQFD